MDNIIWCAKEFSALTTTELYQLLKARAEVFVVEQNCAYLDPDNADQQALHFWAESNEGIIAYCRIFAPGVKYEEASIGRVLTVASARGKNLGRQMMHYAVQICLNRYEAAIRISAQDYLLNFYESFGFKDTGKKYPEDGIPHTEMLRPRASQVQI